MRPSLSQPDLGTHPFGDTPADERLHGLDCQQLADRLTWLSWWAPGTFTTVILSFRVSQVGDLRRPVVDSVVGGTSAG